MIKQLMGKTILKIDRVNDDGEELHFHMNTGETYIQYHMQDCCESVYIEDICGDLSDLLFTPVLNAYEESNGERDEDQYESVTWTFYNISTIKGSVTIRWCGQSNGYYSESVDWRVIKAPEGFVVQHLDEDLFIL